MFIGFMELKSGSKTKKVVWSARWLNIQKSQVAPQVQTSQTFVIQFKQIWERMMGDWMFHNA